MDLSLFSPHLTQRTKYSRWSCQALRSDERSLRHRKERGLISEKIHRRITSEPDAVIDP
jgi:hypothetical protein